MASRLVLLAHGCMHTQVLSNIKSLALLGFDPLTVQTFLMEQAAQNKVSTQAKGGNLGSLASWHLVQLHAALCRFLLALIMICMRSI